MVDTSGERIESEAIPPFSYQDKVYRFSPTLKPLNTALMSTAQRFDNIATHVTDIDEAARLTLVQVNREMSQCLSTSTESSTESFIKRLAPLINIKIDYTIDVAPNGTIILRDEDGSQFLRDELENLNTAILSGWRPGTTTPEEFLERSKKNKLLFDEYHTFTTRVNAPIEEVMTDFIAEATQDAYINEIQDSIAELDQESSSTIVLQKVGELINHMSMLDKHPMYHLTENIEYSALRHSRFYQKLLNVFRNFNQGRHSLFSAEINHQIVQQYLSQENQLTGSIWNYYMYSNKEPTETNWRQFLGLSRNEQEQIRQEGWGTALDYMRAIKEQGTITKEDLIQLHRIICRGFLPASQTGFRNKGVRFGEYEGVLAKNVQEAVDNLLVKAHTVLDKNLPDSLFRVEAAKLYDEFIGIHPFSDKNGSMGVMFLQALSHLNGNELPTRIPQRHKERLLQALGNNSYAFYLAQLLVGIRTKTGEGYQSVPNHTKTQPLFLRILKGSSKISSRKKI